MLETTNATRETRETAAATLPTQRPTGERDLRRALLLRARDRLPTAVVGAPVPLRASDGVIVVRVPANPPLGAIAEARRRLARLVGADTLRAHAAGLASVTLRRMMGIQPLAPEI